MQDQDRRATPRHRLSVRAECQALGEPFAGNVFNLGADGVFICSSEPLGAGTPLHVSITLPGGLQRIEAEGRVMWNNGVGTRDLPAGMGVRFTEVDAESLRLLREHLRELA